ncbi:hypothetical protein HX774_19280 [Brevundimonas sp. P7753]|nr:hypothetical protein [Brevundimonas sp. P7753]
MTAQAGRFGNAIARVTPGTAQRAQVIQQRTQQANLATHPEGWNRLNAAKQAVHSPGTNREGASILNESASKLFERHAGLGQTVAGTRGAPGFRERITEPGRVIGQVVDRAGNAQATDSAIVHYSRTGYHIVPSNPSGNPMFFPVP